MECRQQKRNPGTQPPEKDSKKAQVNDRVLSWLTPAVPGEPGAPSGVRPGC
jgi:hypothetical protein